MYKTVRNLLSTVMFVNSKLKVALTWFAYQQVRGWRIGKPVASQPSLDFKTDFKDFRTSCGLETPVMRLTIQALAQTSAALLVLF
jgi:hypothetical protein